MFDLIKSIDAQLLLTINGWHSHWANHLMWYVSDKYTWFPLYAVFIWFFVKHRKQNVWVTLIAVALMIVLSDQTSDLIKNSVQRLRPTHNPALIPYIHLVKNYSGGMYGFVSSHAANSFAIAAFVSQMFCKRWLTISIFCWAALVAYSRMYLGVHYPLDILGGTMVGLFFGYTISLAEQKMVTYLVSKKKPNNDKLQNTVVSY